ncbi:MAG: hypothetical protein KatS3mg111_3488 [Pirellulaceae bacterium]|nr:MAG: hypothetical protein KatS3mg111_3488 [Pirellulaceae bacterium]
MACVRALMVAWMIATATMAFAEPWPLHDKTLVAWAIPDNLDQRGGSVLTIEKPGGVFDAIVFGELAPATWMPGSDHFHRTLRDQRQLPKETGTSSEPVQIAIVYQGRRITVYRNGERAASYEAASAEKFPDDSCLLMGLRHLDAAPEHRFFVGAIEDARLYASALTDEQIRSLQPNEPSDPEPLAWWDFEEGRATDRQGTFVGTTLVSGARLADGRLILDQPGAYLLATRTVPDRQMSASDPKTVDRLARALREKLASDPHRPGYHFVIPEGTGMPFDPNGAIFWKGRYHLFYIFQDERGHNWGHVSSTDLFHWRHHPTRLVSGMFSGNCFLNREGRPTICYHQVGQGNAMAVALDDDLVDWKKLDSNPITPKTEPGDPFHGRYRSWDPYGWVEGDTYYAIFGGERPGLAKSPSLEGPWKYVGDFLAHAAPGVSLNEDVSCADFFRIGDRYMLLCISHRLGARYYLGEWKNEQFYPTFHERMSWVDNSFFAPESLLDDRGRRIMWAWIFDGPDFQMRTDYGWSGTMSLPRVLTLVDGVLHMEPPEEIERLRFHPRHQADISLAADSEWSWEEVSGNSLELRVVFDTESSQRCGLKVCCSPDGAEQTLVYYDALEKKLKVDTTKSSLRDGAKTVEAGPFALAEGEPLELRVFVDKSVVEVFANGRQAVMRRIYPSRGDSVGVKCFAAGGTARVVRADAWEMMASNPY